jgi:hypothetical protein
VTLTEWIYANQEYSHFRLESAIDMNTRCSGRAFFPALPLFNGLPYNTSNHNWTSYVVLGVEP